VIGNAVRITGEAGNALAEKMAPERR